MAELILVAPQNAADEGASETEGLDELIEALGGTPAQDNPAGDAGDNNAGDNADTSNTDAGASGADEGADDGGNSDEGAQQQQQQQNAAQEKQSKAFAQMRVQLGQQSKLINGIAQLLGIPANTPPQELYNGLQQRLIEAQAKQQNVPPQLLSRLNYLEDMTQNYARQNLEQQAYKGFADVKAQFKLTDEQVNAFADELTAQGINPFIAPVDLVTQYKLKHFDELIKNAREEGIQSEVSRAAKATQNSTTPDGKTGGKVEEPSKVNSLRELDSWLNSHAK